MTDEPLEPRLTPSDARALRCLPAEGKQGRPLWLDHDGLHFVLVEHVAQQVRGLVHLGYAQHYDSGRCGRTAKGDEYLAGLDAPETPVEQGELA